MLNTTGSKIEIRAQRGPQENFLSTPADIAIFGGAAGGGKTWAILLETIRHLHNPHFGAVIFRRSYPEITGEGGMWDETKTIFPYFDAVPNETNLHWTFPSGARLTFAHMQLERDRERWKGAQIPLICFDQLESFMHAQFWYMLSRNRSTCGVRPYIRATANPEPGWLAELLSWWIGSDGFAIPERSGIVRWFVRDAEQIIWGERREDLLGKFHTPDGTTLEPKSLTFILSRIYDNPILLKKDPGYLANLMALPLVDRERLLGDRERGGNWKIRPSAGNMFRREWFGIVNQAPADAKRVRSWDLAATDVEPGKDPDWTAGVKMSEKAGIFYIEDVRRVRTSPAGVEKLVSQTARLDTRAVPVWIEEEGGSAGKNTIDHYRREVLKGYAIRGMRTTGSKVERANPLSAAAEGGNVKLVAGEWNEAFLVEAEQFPPEKDKGHDDQIDGASQAHKVLTSDVTEWGEQELRDVFRRPTDTKQETPMDLLRKKLRGEA